MASGTTWKRGRDGQVVQKVKVDHGAAGEQAS